MGLPACRTLVAGHDFSAGSRAGLRLAIAWGRRVEASLEVVHAFDRPAPDPRTAPALAQLIREELEELLRGQASGTPGTSVAAQPVVGVLAGMARAARDGWIVAGCEGLAAGFERRGGGIATSLARDDELDVPRLLAPRAFGESADAGFERLLVALPDPGQAHHLVSLLEDAAELARRLGARLSGVHSIDVARSEGWPAECREADLAAASDRADAVRDELSAIFEDRVPVDVGDVVHVVVQGPVAGDVAGLAASQAIDLIVTGPGSTAARLVARTPCPLLILPTQREPDWAAETSATSH